VWYYCKCNGVEHEVNVENDYDNDDSKIVIIIIVIIIIILKPQTIGIQTFPSQCIKREMLQYCAIKQYREREREREKLQQIGQI
jgi:hypothetical protein